MSQSILIKSALLFFFYLPSLLGETIHIDFYQTEKSGKGRFLGTVVAIDTEYGLYLKPDLKDLPPGPHGFHLHEGLSCDNMGQAAGGHYDPAGTKSHKGPYDNRGHLGDLPVLIVDAKGRATIPILAPRLSTEDLPGHTLIIHENSDTYSDTPEMGGGGKRIACGLIPYP